MVLSWNEIKKRAVVFSKEWENETSEKAEAQSFWNDFFNVFGIERRRVATFETKVTKQDRKDGKIDLIWKGQLLVEHKSSGKDLNRAYKQAVDYFPGLEEHELPKYIVVCNFQKFRIYDLDEDTKHEFDLKDLVNNVHYFDFIAGYKKRTYEEDDPVNIEAAMLMGELHDRLKEVGYTGHYLEVYLVRLLFCLFADDTNIFELGIFQDYIDYKTNKDGSDLAYHLAPIFHTLNAPKEKRLSNLDEALNAFPFVNGKLFEENIPVASFDSEMRQILLECCRLDWGRISPSIFGSLFQSVMNPVERRNLGAHYTSEKNILKLIKPLFLDELWAEFDEVKGNSEKLKEFHNKIARLRFLDPACGCGNFLVISYRELRLLEIEIIRILYKGQQVDDISDLVKVDIDHFYGFEIEEFPAQVAQVAMWLIEHQMNMKISQEIGKFYFRLPLKKSANIFNENALRFNWGKIIDTNKKNIKNGNTVFDYILGNPPFVGKQHQSDSQNADIDFIFEGVQGAGVLDYVTCWYIKAAQYIKNKHTKVAYVSTNSISQGEQVGILWNELFSKYKIKIHFAHQTFKWSNEAKGVAAVYCVIIGFANYDNDKKILFEYDTVKSKPKPKEVENINPYLVEGNDTVIVKRRKQISNAPEITFGSMPNDGGHLLLTDKEKDELLKNEPETAKYIKPLISSKEYLNGIKRWCLWLVDMSPRDLNNSKEILRRVKKVKQHRLESRRVATQRLAAFPKLFGEIRQPNSDYIFIPLTTSENRKYIPIDIISKDKISNNTVSLIPTAGLYYFGMIISEMHMVWVRYICGRLKSDYRYSNELVYNNYPFPDSSTVEKINKVEENAKRIIEVRKEFPKSSLVDLYDTNSMPPRLVRAHQELDKAVDKCYRSQPFISDTNRLEFLFELYNEYISPLTKKQSV